MLSTVITTAEHTPAPVVSASSHNQATPKLEQLLRIAMGDCDRYVLELDYADSKGNCTRRMVSPIRFQGEERFLGLCLCREEPRQFHVARCRRARLVPAAEVMMPVELIDLEA